MLGGGPAGISAALQARELGAEVTLVEAERIGGTSLNDGPAPVRTLARAARMMRDAKSWDRLGLRGAPPEIDIAAALPAPRRVADYAARPGAASPTRCGRRGVELVDERRRGGVRRRPHGRASPTGASSGGDAVVDRGRAGAPAGSRSPAPSSRSRTTDSADLTALPASVAVIGGADTGCQLASILGDFGVDVTPVEAAPRLVAARRPGRLRRARRIVPRPRHHGADRRPGRAARTRRRRASTVHHRSGDAPGRLAADAVFFAVGWPGNADSWLPSGPASSTPAATSRSMPALRSSVPHVFAAGDVNGISMLVPSARHEGRIAAENAVLGTRRRFTHEIVPTGSFTDPEYGSVGLTEAPARERYDCEVAVVRYDDLVRPVVDAHPDGFCKLIVERHRRYILGAHVVGEYSAEVIQTVAACMAANLRIEQVAELHPAFPTFTEGVTVAARMIVRAMGIAPSAPSWGEVRGSDASAAG